MPTTHIQGKSFYFKTFGEGFPLIFLHPSMCSHQIWEKQIPLSEDFQLWLLDLPGHGGSEPIDGEVSIQQLTNVIADFIRSQNLNPFVSIGNSIGGAISLQLAINYPNLVQAIILIGTGAKMGVLPVIFQAIQTNYPTMVEKTIGQIGFAKSVDPQIIDQVKASCLGCRSEIAYADFQACNNFDVRHLLADIQVPALVIVGSEDLLTPVKWSKYLAAHISNATLEIIPNAGHFVMLEQPALVNQVILKFLHQQNIE